ncbi:MAG: hypothetical protein D6768_18565 [Chloroflexi bacterium]|nr:MAG: hypothetical protein D6768_18565 [Chloroflexota bacterium]
MQSLAFCSDFKGQRRRTTGKNLWRSALQKIINCWPRSVNGMNDLTYLSAKILDFFLIMLYCNKFSECG